MAENRRPSRCVSGAIARGLLALAVALSIVGGTSTKAAAAVTIVSLGDSYSSGEGTSPYDSETDRKDYGHKCHRSAGAWPRLIGARSENHLACSGAKVENILKSGQTTRGRDKAAQLSQLKAIRDAGAIDYATVTIGGNDLDFADRLKQCYLDGNVKGCLKDREQLKTELSRQRSRLAGVYRDINIATRGGTTLVVGYPDIFPSPDRGDRCLWLTKGMKENIEWFSGRLDATLAAAAADAKVSYLSVRNVLDYHELCTGTAWVRALGGKPGDIFGDQQQGHPLKEGQNAIATSVLQWIRSHPRPGAAVPANPVSPPPPPAPAAPSAPAPDAPPAAAVDAGIPQTAGGVVHTWTNPANAGGSQGPSIAKGQTVGVACKLPGFAVANGNTWWYRIAASPWSGNYYASADAFYNNGANSGPLAGTPFVDPAVPDCNPAPPAGNPAPPAAAPTWSETTGGVANTWSNHTNAGGTQGPTIAKNQTVQIACKLQGFRVANGNTWWYRIAQSPWNGQFYVSADAFYNNGQTSGSLRGTPFVDGAVADC